jgi:sugar fermentation stimulation protein A
VVEGIELFSLEGVVECSIVRRLNRFVILVKRDGREYLAHTNNTSRLRGFLEEGRRAYCLPRSGGKTQYRLVAVECPGYREAALIDTGLQMRGFEKAVEKDVIPWLRGCRVVSRNPRVGSSLLDYLLRCGSEEVYVEVKSATLRLPGDLAAYPDPASMRGRRHVEELTRLAESGRKALLVFIAGIPGAQGLTLYREADPVLPGLVKRAIEKGVVVKAVAMSFDPRGARIVLYSVDLPVVI